MTRHCSVRVTRRYEAPPRQVWAALTRPESLARWLGRPNDVELEPGGPFVLELPEGDRGDGRRRLYSLDPAPLAELDGWLERYRAFWANRLDALDIEIRRQRRQR